MTVLDFQENLRQTGQYHTPPERVRKPVPVPLASFFFHLRILGIITRGGLQAYFPEFETKEWRKFCYRIHRLSENLGGNVSFTGFDQVNNAAFPAVWVANHVSALETYLLPQAIMAYTRLSIILKTSLKYYPAFGQIVRSINPITVNRKNALEDLRRVLTKGQELLAEGRSVLVFPEGHRMLTFDPAQFNSMGVKLAQRAGVPVIPVAVKPGFMKLNSILKDLPSIHPRETIRYACGPVLPPSMPPKEIHATCLDFIASKMEGWRKDSDG